VDGDDFGFHAELDRAMTDFVRLARHPALTERMSEGIDPRIDRRLLVILNLIVDRGPLRAADLVDLLAVDQSTVSRQLAALDQHGLVDREVDPRDRRASLVEASAYGHEVIDRARGAWRRMLADLTAEWSPDLREAFLLALRDLANGLAAMVPNARSSTP
jgi:DNA-binding MarR family transcriptional regulator